MLRRCGGERSTGSEECGVVAGVRGGALRESRHDPVADGGAPARSGRPLPWGHRLRGGAPGPAVAVPPLAHRRRGQAAAGPQPHRGGALTEFAAACADVRTAVRRGGRRLVPRPLDGDLHPAVVSLSCSSAGGSEIVSKLSGLLQSVVSDSGIGAVLESAAKARAVEVPALRIEGPAGLRPFLAAGIGAERTVLAVTATDREAEDLGAAAADLLGPAAVEVLPSWETLPHERLSPRPDTVGRRLSIFRRLSEPTGAPQVVVVAARSLIQPIAPGL